MPDLVRFSLRIVHESYVFFKISWTRAILINYGQIIVETYLFHFATIHFKYDTSFRFTLPFGVSHTFLATLTVWSPQRSFGTSRHFWWSTCGEGKSYKGSMESP